MKLDPHSKPKLDHLKRMTDCTGIIQHAVYSIPDRETGYTTDDNARALITAVKIYEQYQDPAALELAVKYVGFLKHAQTPSGKFRNYMNYERRFVEDEGSEDCFGRAIWACGYTCAGIPGDSAALTARDLISRSIPVIVELKALRARAFSLCGLYYYLRKYPGDREAMATADRLTHTLIRDFERTASPSWQWFENALTYSNGAIPLSLYLAFDLRPEPKRFEIAEKSLGFLTSRLWRKDRFKLVGNKGWYPRGRKPAEFDEQPVDAGCLVQAYTVAYSVTKKEEHYEKALAAYEWFHGRNCANIPVYDRNTGGCHDGLTPDGLNLNQGAESLLEFLLAHLSLKECIEARKGDVA